MASGEIQGVTNVGILTEGFDCPDVGCIILARPTKSLGLYRQMVGRGLRPAPGKTDVIILDHAGAVYRHGLPQDPIRWSLNPDKKAEATAHTKASPNFESSKRLIECSKCSAIREGGKACPHCGFLPQRPPRAFTTHDGELGLVTNGRAQVTLYSAADRERFHAMLLYICQECDWKPGAAYYKYKEKFGVPPPRGPTPEPIEPTPEVRSWVKSRTIAYYKRKQAETVE